MDRLAFGVTAAFAVVAFASVPQPVGAQTLEKLHVRDFTMSADRTSLRVGETFHLTIAARVAERVLELDNVTLPELSGFDVLGDERRCSASERGSDCTETLTLAPNVAGDPTIAATTMDAIDARNGKPSRFGTNTLALHVAGAPPHLPNSIADVLWPALIGIVLPLVLVALGAWGLIWGFGRRKIAPRLPVPQPPPFVPEPVAEDVHTRLRALAMELAAEPTRARAFAVRAALRESVGARDDETLADLAARRAAGERASILAALHAIERASFCEESHVARAVREALPSLNF